MKNTMITKIYVVCLFALAMLLPAAALAVEWNDIHAGLSKNTFYSYDGGSAVISGDTLTISGGTVVDFTCHEVWDLNVSNILFENVKLEQQDEIVNLVLCAGDQSKAYRVEFDVNTTAKPYQMIVGGAFADAATSSSLTFVNNGIIQTTAEDPGYNLLGIRASGNIEITFINNGSITTGDFFGYAKNNSRLSVEQNGTVSVPLGDPSNFHCSASNEATLNVNNTNKIIGSVNCQSEDSASMSFDNSGSISGKVYYYTKSSNGNLVFKHSGSVGENLQLDLRGNYPDFQYCNTGYAAEPMEMKVWGDTVINGIHAPTASTPQNSTLWLYPYFSITNSNDALSKAAVMFGQLKQIGIAHANLENVLLRRRFQLSDGPIQDDYENILANYTFILGGDNPAFSDSGDLQFGVDAEYNLLRSVRVDGAELSDDDYSVQAGSTYITLKESFLKTLSPGKHRLNVRFYGLGGSLSTNFTVTSVSTAVNNMPQTGDHSHIVLWFTLLSLAGTSLLILKRKVA